MNKWIKHEGEERPVPYSTIVRVQYEDGTRDSKQDVSGDVAGHWQWDQDQGGKTIAYYQIVEDDFVEVSELDGQKPVVDMVNNPSHYTSHKSGVECIEITRHMGFNLGNAMKYIWRCDLKKDAIEDLKKAVFYLNDEISLREQEKQKDM